MKIIDKAHKKIKEIMTYSWFDELVWVAVIMFVALGAFSLGVFHERKQYLRQHPVTVTYSESAVKLWSQYHKTNNQGKNFFASKNGSVVYPIDCSAGNRVKEENRIYFESIEQALDEEYRESSSC